MVAGNQGMKHDLKSLSPAYFGIVMATGIISLTAHMLGFDLIAISLFTVNVGFYGVLWAATFARFLRHRREFLLDVIDHPVSYTHLTLPTICSV